VQNEKVFLSITINEHAYDSVLIRNEWSGIE
jgi:hypothetical protein